MYAVACWVALKWRNPSSRVVEWLRIGVIIFFAVAFRATLVPQRPYLSSDVYRYVWDGHLQAQGINPYVYLPDAPELVPLRDEEKFPDMVKIYPNMSWLHLPTPYPPAAQAIYLFVYLIHPLNVTTFKAATLAFDLLTILALMLHAVTPLSTDTYLILGTVLLGAFALWWMIRKKRDVVDVTCGAATLITVYLILSSPHYAWHYAWLLPFLCFAPRLGWLYLAGASVFMYLLWYVPTVYPDMPVWLGLAMFAPTVALLFWERRKPESKTRNDGLREF